MSPSGMIQNRRRLAVFIPFFIIWGLQWMIDALLDFWGPWNPNGLVHTGITGIAVILSIVAALRQSRDSSSDSLWSSGIKSYLPVVALLASLWLLIYVQAIDVNYLHLFLVVALILIFLQMGIHSGSELIWLGLWLFVLTLILSIWYLGYTGVILEFFGGLSMLAAAIIIYLWNKV
jgi:hypothetical protein